MAIAYLVRLSDSMKAGACKLSQMTGRAENLQGVGRRGGFCARSMLGWREVAS